MDILYLMVICSVSLAVIFLVVFVISAKKGQFEDDESPAVRILLEDQEHHTEQKERGTDKKKQEN